MVKCPLCNKSFKQLHGAHLKTHSLTTKQFKALYPNIWLGNVNSVKTVQAKLEKDQSIYECKHCRTVLMGLDRKRRVFCSKSCAAKHNNVHRNPKTYVCLQCNSPFECKSGNPRKFCSPECSSLHRRIKRVEVKCCCCKEATVSLTETVLAKRTRVFCSNKCKNQFFKETNLRGPIAKHNGTSAKSTYRIRAFKHFPAKCAECNFDKFPDVLQVHHKDENRKNNELSNLIILCPTCHILVHRGHIILPG